MGSTVGEGDGSFPVVFGLHPVAAVATSEAAKVATASRSSRRVAAGTACVAASAAIAAEQNGHAASDART